MRTEVIKADTIDAAAEWILDELKEDTNATSRSISSKDNVIYFDGWDGLGASAVLRAVASKAPATGLEVIHIDCSKWKSKRALQRAIAEQLKLPDEVMEMFDSQDEDDDFNGVAQDSRGEIPQIVAATYQCIQTLSSRLLLIFQNGSCDEVDLTSLGFPLYGYSRIKVLWTFQGSLRLYPRMKADMVLESTDIFLSASCSEQALEESWWAYLVRQEAEEVASRNAGSSIIDQPALVSECFMYVLKLCCMGNQSTVLCDLATHVGNYLVCDGIIREEGGVLGSDHLWQAADALHHEMQLDVDNYNGNRKYSHLVKWAEITPCWSSPTYRVTQIPDEGILSRGVFQNFDKLCILNLSRCNLSFSSPPFLCCNNLRFLLLNHCQEEQAMINADEAGKKEEDNCQEDQAMINADGAGKKEEEGIGQCFQRLWVLDVRHTRCDRILYAEMMALLSQLRELNVMGAQDWDMGQLILGRLPNIRKLRVTKSTIICSSSSSSSLAENGDLFWGMMKNMELLEFSGNRIMRMKSLTMAANNISLLVETIIIDEGSVGLEQVSFRGCPTLKNILLRRLFQELRSIDISGTAVKTLDVSAMVAPSLDEFVALGCDNLCAILWPPKGKMKEKMRKLRIGTTVEDNTNAATRSSLSVKYGSRAPTEYDWYVSVKDARLLRSLVVFEDHYNNIYVHMEVSSAPGLADVGGEEESMIIKSGCQLEMDNASVYEGVAVTLKLQQDPTQIWPCPRALELRQNNCYTYIQEPPHQPKLLPGEKVASSGSITTVPDMICLHARILHVHDSKFITCVPGPLQGSTWRFLKWCRVERCPSLDCVFYICLPERGGSSTIFNNLETLWASQLPRARCIWNLSRTSSIDRDSFHCLEFMHVEFCSRLTHVLPLPTTFIRLGNLETLEIVWCGHLTEIFPTTSDDEEESQGYVLIQFPWLNRIHLHELPMLHAICGRGRTMYTPNLESIKIRGCWSLTHLPFVPNKQVECDCEKEWWDKLKWDGKEKDKYKPMHPPHYKKTFLRTSVLR